MSKWMDLKLTLESRDLEEKTVKRFEWRIMLSLLKRLADEKPGDYVWQKILEMEREITAAESLTSPTGQTGPTGQTEEKE